MVDKDRVLRLSEPDMTQEETEAISKALMGGRIGGDGPVGRALEEAMASRLGAGRVLLTTSCSHALEMAFLALDLQPGDEVILPSFTFVSAANAVLRCGARVVFADIEPGTLNLSVEDAAGRVTDRTRAICPTHYAGIGCDMKGFVELSEPRGLPIVEDAAHALGSKYGGRELGTLGDIGCYSFHETKNVVCGEGGAFVTSDEELARRAEVIREKGTDRAAFLRGEVDRYTWRSLGSSYVLSDLLAALLEVQWKRMDEMNARRVEIFHRYLQAFADLEAEGRVRLPQVGDGCEPNGHLFYAVHPCREERDRVVEALRAEGIQSSFHFLPLHASPYARERLGMEDLSLPVTESASAGLLRLPLHSKLTDADVDRVIETYSRIVRSQ
jgi:dTDP-4-amino-4,6-dideoxygalactose transaminase